MSDTCSTFGGRKEAVCFVLRLGLFGLKSCWQKMNYVISFIRNTLNAKYSGIQIKE